MFQRTRENESICVFERVCDPAPGRNRVASDVTYRWKARRVVLSSCLLTTELVWAPHCCVKPHCCLLLRAAPLLSESRPLSSPSLILFSSLLFILTSDGCVVCFRAILDSLWESLRARWEVGSWDFRGWEIHWLWKYKYVSSKSPSPACGPAIHQARDWHIRNGESLLWDAPRPRALRAAELSKEKILG